MGRKRGAKRPPKLSTHGRHSPKQKPATLSPAKRIQGRSIVKLKSYLAALAITTMFAASAYAAPASPGQVFGKLISGQAEEVVSAAEAMPADKYDFAPTTGEFKGVRTFGQQITHIVEAQYFFFGNFGAKPTIDVKSLDKLTSKDEIVKALKESFAFAQHAAESMTAQNAFEEIPAKDGTNTRASITAFSLAHTNDHYGQMVVYLRLNGIIPPASRK
jgi:uncharacterized damage-inducible protein DinB